MTVTADELARVMAARAFVHATVCVTLAPRVRYQVECVACPTGSGTLAALRLLDQRPRDARGARRALHDVVCMSGCGPESDHADRTQAKTAAALRKFRAQETSVPGNG